MALRLAADGQSARQIAEAEERKRREAEDAARRLEEDRKRRASEEAEQRREEERKQREAKEAARRIEEQRKRQEEERDRARLSKPAEKPPTSVDMLSESLRRIKEAAEARRRRIRRTILLGIGTFALSAIVVSAIITLWPSSPKSSAPTSKMPTLQAGQTPLFTAWPFDAAEAARRQDETAKALGVPKDSSLGEPVSLRLVLLPAGRFIMGTAPEDLPKLPPEETPQTRSWFEKTVPDEGPPH